MTKTVIHVQSKIETLESQKEELASSMDESDHLNNHQLPV